MFRLPLGAHPTLIPLFQEETQKLLIERVRLTCALAVLLILIFNVLDWILYPLQAFEFLFIRLAVILFCGLIAVFSFLPIGKRHPRVLGILLYTGVAWFVVLLCLMTEGHRSPYYAGINLVILAYSIIMPWPLRDAILASLLTYGAYLGGMLLWDDIQNVGVFTSNNFFIVSTLVIAISASWAWEFFRETQFLDKQRLKEVDQSKSNFLATISHELKTPLTLIVNPIEQAFEEGGRKTITLKDQQVSVIRRNVYQLANLISDLIEISRGNVGKAELSPSDVEKPHEYFEELYSSITPLFKEKSISTFLEIATPLKPHYFDVKKMDKVIYNLLSNALKFTSAGGKVTVRVWDDAEGPLNFSVEDTGIGIASEKLPHIFERFMQIEEGASRSYEGMGIGLSLVKDFVEQHGGTVKVTSEVGKGSLFQVVLPRGSSHFTVPVVRPREKSILERKRETPYSLARNHQSPSRPPLISPKKISPQQKTLLVVDDNADVRDSLHQILSPDYNIVFSENGQEALAYLEATTETPHLVISDIMMPVMNGYQMVREMKKKERFRDLPILLLSAKSGEEALSEGFSAGANDYMTKPFSPHELKLRVKNLLLLRELIDEEMMHHQNLASVGTLSAGVSHNMNSFAATMDCGLTLLERLLKRESFSNYRVKIESALHSARVGLHSLQEMIETLAVYSQKNVEGFREEDIIKTTKAVVDLARTKISQKILLQWQAPASLSCWFNPHILNPAIMNIIDNAAEACKDKGSIDVAISNGDSDVLITIKDTGGGIPVDVQHKIWAPYFTTKGHTHGTGLGLWMVKRAVEMHHGGQVWFETHKKGTTFFVKIPKRGTAS